MEKPICKHMSLSLVWLTTKYQTETGEWSENKYRTKKKGKRLSSDIFGVTHLNTYKLARRKETQMDRLNVLKLMSSLSAMHYLGNNNFLILYVNSCNV